MVWHIKFGVFEHYWKLREVLGFNQRIFLIFPHFFAIFEDFSKFNASQKLRNIEKSWGDEDNLCLLFAISPFLVLPK